MKFKDSTGFLESHKWFSPIAEMLGRYHCAPKSIILFGNSIISSEDDENRHPEAPKILKMNHDVETGVMVITVKTCKGKAFLIDTVFLRAM